MTNEDMRTTECKVLTKHVGVKETLSTNSSDTSESDEMEPEDNQRETEILGENNRPETADVPILVTDILNELVDRVIDVGIDSSISEEQTSTDSGIQTSEPASSRSTKEFYRRTFVFDDSNLDEREFSEEEAEGTDDILGDSRESVAYNLEENLDENDNKSVCTTPVIAVNNLVINKYEIKPLSKSSETISVKAEERPKRVKKFSLSSMFRRKEKPSKEEKAANTNNKSKTEIEHEDYDNFDPFQNFSSSPSKSLLKSKKFSSAFDISEKAATGVHRTPSLKKKLANLHTETKTLFRSMSFRDISKKKEKQKLAEQKHVEWKSSLQQLVENDPGISYNDFSFVNYDQLNTVSYSTSTPDKKQANVHRTQSMVEKVSS